MVGNYNIGDVVKYQGKIYKITECHAINWFTEHEPVVYGLILVGQKPKSDRGEAVYVRESLLKPLSPKEIITWRLLYGKK
jgi:hypothetical protein